MARAGGQGGRQVYRPVLSRVLIVLAAAFGLWWDVDLLLRSRPGQAALAALWLGAAFCALASIFWRPAVVVDDDAAELRNVVRDVRVPWSALEGVETRFALTLLSGGRSYSSWAATSGGRPPRRRPSDVGVPVRAGLDDERGPVSRHLRTATGTTAFMIEQKWQEWQQAERRRAFLASRAEPASPAEARAEPDGAEDREPDGVVVRWRPHLAVAAVAAAALAAALTPVLN